MSQKPHLDDFFAAARREEPVISHDEIGELIDARHIEHTSTIHHITWKGMSMTTIGLGLAGVLSYFAFFSSDSTTTDAPVAQSALSVQSSEPPTVAPEIKTLVEPRIPASGDATIDEVETATEVVRVEAPIKVDEVNITEPGQDDMKRLGMKVDGGREVVIVQKVGKKFFVVTYGAKPFKVSSQLETENPTDIEPSEVLPIFVTNLNGTGILTAAAPNENTSITTSEIHSSDENSGKKERTIERTQTNIVVSNGEDANVDISTDINIAVPPVLSDENDFKFEFKLDSTMATAFASEGKARANARILVKHGDENVNIDVSDVQVREGTGETKEVRININDGNEVHGININGLDSMRKKVFIARLDADSAMFGMNDLSKEMELVKENVAKVMKDFNVRINDSSAHIDMQKMMEQLQDAKLDIQKAKKQFMMVKPKLLRAKKQAFIVPGFSELKAKVNELVPMRVALDENKGKGLIFWYEPSNAPVVQKQEMQAVSKATSIEGLTINPNPAQNHTTVRFTMKDAHAVTISVHDILGKRLLEAGQVVAGAGGAFSREIDLSSLTQGVYLLVLTTDTGEQRIERILVNK